MTCLVMWAGKSCSEREKGKEGLKLEFSSSSTHLSFVSLKLQNSVFALYVKPGTDRLSLSECFWFIMKTLRRKLIFFLSVLLWKAMEIWSWNAWWVCKNESWRKLFLFWAVWQLGRWKQHKKKKEKWKQCKMKVSYNYFSITRWV